MSQKVTELSVLDKIQTTWVCESVSTITEITKQSTMKRYRQSLISESPGHQFYKLRNQHRNLYRAQAKRNSRQLWEQEATGRQKANNQGKPIRMTPIQTIRKETMPKMSSSKQVAQQTSS